MHSELLDVTVLFGVSLAVALGFQRLRLPPVVGFVVAGALFGPRSLRLVSNEELVEQLAEVGVVVLLFAVGLELASGPLRTLRRQILIGGSLQVGLTVLLGSAAACALGAGMGTSVLVGFLIALSSTAAITKLLGERGELGSPPGRLAVAICIAQDFAVVAMVLVLPLLAGGDAVNGLLPNLIQVGRTLLGLAVVIGVGVLVVTRLLAWVAHTRSREFFVLAVVTICLAMAIATAAIELSPALGAFLAGLILGRGHHRHQAMAEIEPFRDALSSLFFVSIGMLFDPRVLVESPLTVVAVVAAVVTTKASVGWLAGAALGAPRWVAVSAGLMIAQVGEFSFVLVQAVRGTPLLPDAIERVFVVAAVLSIALTPALIAAGRPLGRWLSSHLAPDELSNSDDGSALRDHVVLVGFGPAGRTLADALEALGVDYRAIEMNAATVESERRVGRAIQFGDASRPAVLHSVDLERARALVIAINDPRATRQIVAMARTIASHVRILARAQFLGDVAGLRSAGADEVVAQEFETSIEMLVRTLRRLLVPEDVIGQRVRAVRESAGLRRAAPIDRGTASGELALSMFGLDIGVARIEGGCEVTDRTLAELDLRARAGLTVVAVRPADGRLTLELGPDTRLGVGDEVVVVGPKDRIAPGLALFRGG